MLLVAFHAAVCSSSLGLSHDVHSYLHMVTCTLRASYPFSRHHVEDDGEKPELCMHKMAEESNQNHCKNELSGIKEDIFISSSCVVLGYRDRDIQMTSQELLLLLLFFLRKDLRNS